MKAATVHEIKQELMATKPAELAELCLRLARFKKENKELLTYLLFEAHDEAAYIAGLKKDIDDQFDGINLSHLYFAKKTLRKILRGIGKHVRYMSSKQAEVELLIYFCRKLVETGIPIEKNVVISNMYISQVKKIHAAIKTLHEDLQHDYLKELEKA
jgi:hypothetical protein